MRRTMMILLAAGMVFLSSCGQTVDTQDASETVQENAGTMPDTSETDRDTKTASDSEASSDGNAQKSENETSTSDGQKAVTGVEVSFDFSRMPTQASNQVAVWVEDEAGKAIKTIYVSGFTGAGRGYQKRKDAVPHWVAAADPDALSNEKIDAVSSATLRNGSQSFVWDLTDNEGNTVPSGKYTVMLEGTLFWSSNVVYSGSVDTGLDVPGEVEVREECSEPDNTENEDMIRNVKMAERGADND